VRDTRAAFYDLCWYLFDMDTVNTPELTVLVAKKSRYIMALELYANTSKSSFICIVLMITFNNAQS